MLFIVVFLCRYCFIFVSIYVWIEFFVMQADRRISHAARHFLKFAQQHVEQYLNTQWVRNELHNLDLN